MFERDRRLWLVAWLFLMVPVNEQSGGRISEEKEKKIPNSFLITYVSFEYFGARFQVGRERNGEGADSGRTKSA